MRVSSLWRPFALTCGTVVAAKQAVTHISKKSQQSMPQEVPVRKLTATENKVDSAKITQTVKDALVPSDR